VAWLITISERSAHPRSRSTLGKRSPLARILPVHRSLIFSKKLQRSNTSFRPRPTISWNYPHAPLWDSWRGTAGNAGNATPRYCGPLGPLGFERAQQANTSPFCRKDGSAERPCFLLDRSQGPQGSSPPVQMARGEWLKGGPQSGISVNLEDRARIHTRKVKLRFWASSLRLNFACPSEFCFG